MNSLHAILSEIEQDKQRLTKRFGNASLGELLVLEEMEKDGLITAIFKGEKK